MYALPGEVCANAILSVSFGLLLGLFKNKLGDVPVQVVVLDSGWERRAHLGPHQVGDDRGERRLGHCSGNSGKLPSQLETTATPRDARVHPKCLIVFGLWRPGLRPLAWSDVVAGPCHPAPCQSEPSQVRAGWARIISAMRTLSILHLIAHV